MTTLFLFIVGIGLLVVAYQGHRKGEIPAGSAGFKAYRPTRDDNPFAFHFFLVLYMGSGFSLLLWGVMVLAGLAEPLPLN